MPDKGGWLLLRQPVLGRVAIALGTGPLAFVVGAGCFVQLPAQIGAPLAIAWLAACVLGAVRGYRLAVIITANTVVVRGLFRTRTIPRRSIVAITLGPALSWLDRSGRRRRTPMTALMTTSREALTHFLLDGHHKMQAAAATGHALHLLTLVSIDASLAQQAEVERLPHLRRQDNTTRPPSLA